MIIYLLVLLFFMTLIVISGVRITPSKLSEFELNRRAKINDKKALEIISRRESTNDIISLQRIFVSILLSVIVIVSVLNLGWLIGLAISLFVAIFYGSIARIGFVRKISNKLYKKIEKTVISFVRTHVRLMKLLRGIPINNSNYENYHISSRQELQHLISESDTILTSDEKNLIVNGLDFNNKIVDSIMTPRNMITGIDKSEFLGPLALDDLHKVGHSYLPVFYKDIDHIVGILDINDLFALDTKLSTTAEKVMSKKVSYIKNIQTLPDVLTTFLQTNSHILIVVNNKKKTVGIVSLVDVVKSLMGRDLI
ncbi:MAG: magnesium and cobalt exporter, family [Patescibacteria group bacterium]|nr:magnesium and cobalt exporter, family [Patescibacteria group bacterium]